MITLFVIFIILILIVALSRNYFIGSVKNDKPLFSDLFGKRALSTAEINMNNMIVKSDKIINQDLCISINGKLLTHSHDIKLHLKSTNEVNSNYKFKLLNISSGNDIVIYHPDTNSYLYVNGDKLMIGQLHILKPENIEKAKFNLIYKTERFNTVLNKLQITDKLSKLGSFTLQHSNTGLYLGMESTSSQLILRELPVDTKLVFYSLMNKIGKVNELVKNMVEGFGVDKSDENRNKRGMCSMVQNGLVPSSLIPCNLRDEIESFNNSINSDGNDSKGKTNEFEFNIFNPHIKMDYQKLFKSYGDNLYNDDLEAIDGVNVIDYLKNYHMSLLNKNTDLQTFIDKESIKMENILDTKMEDLELIKLNKDSMRYYTFKDQV
jgi:hypothetical protein